MVLLCDIDNKAYQMKNTGELAIDEAAFFKYKDKLFVSKSDKIKENYFTTPHYNVRL